MAFAEEEEEKILDKPASQPTTPVICGNHGSDVVLA